MIIVNKLFIKRNKIYYVNIVFILTKIEGSKGFRMRHFADYLYGYCSTTCKIHIYILNYSTNLQIILIGKLGTYKVFNWVRCRNDFGSIFLILLNRKSLKQKQDFFQNYYS